MEPPAAHRWVPSHSENICRLAAFLFYTDVFIPFFPVQSVSIPAGQSRDRRETCPPSSSLLLYGRLLLHLYLPLHLSLLHLHTESAGHLDWQVDQWIINRSNLTNPLWAITDVWLTYDWHYTCRFSRLESPPGESKTNTRQQFNRYVLNKIFKLYYNSSVIVFDSLLCSGLCVQCLTHGWVIIPRISVLWTIPPACCGWPPFFRQTPRGPKSKTGCWG